MRHSFIDKYSDLDSPIHRLDPRVKLVSFLFFIMMVVLTPGPQASFAGYLLLLSGVVALSRVPVSYVLGRSLLIVPVLVAAGFLVFVSGRPQALSEIFAMMLKSWLSALAAIVLSATTRFDYLLRGLEKLKVPRIFILLLSFMYRYIFILVDEAVRLQRSRDSRYFGGNAKRQIAVFAHIVGSLFIRTFERGERVYRSMMARGFDGEIKTVNALGCGKEDFVFVLLFAAGLLFITMGLPR